MCVKVFVLPERRCPLFDSLFYAGKGVYSTITFGLFHVGKGVCKSVCVLVFIKKLL